MRFVKIRRNRIDDTNIKSARIMAKIAVVGRGQGGMVAAIRLAKQGHVVTVFEKSKRGEVSYDWRDDIRADVFEAVENGSADYGVLPIENSTAGDIRQTYDLLAKYNFYICKRTQIKINHCFSACSCE